MLVLSWYETILISMALSFLTALESRLTNPTEIAGLEAAVTFLQSLLGPGVSVKEATPKPTA
jgi:hypothetical protein